MKYFVAACAVLLGLACIGVIGNIVTQGSSNLASDVIFSVLFIALDIWLFRKAWRMFRHKEAEKTVFVDPAVLLSKARENNPDYDEQTGEVALGGVGTRKKAIKHWEKGLKELWSGLEDIEFDYEDANRNKTRRKIQLSAILHDGKRVYFRGYCYDREDDRTFNVDSINSDILQNGELHDVFDFMVKELGIRNKRLGLL